MITSIKEFKNSLNENLLIPRRSKDERNLKLLQNNYRKLCNNETFEGRLLIDSGFDFPSNFNIDNIKLKIINGPVRLKLNYIPKWLQNVTINGDFDCHNNKYTTLQYCPSIINGFFDCSENKLTSLEYGPTTVEGNFTCSYNLLTTLKGCPTSVGHSFYCYNNKLTSLEYCPNIINGSFNCQHNQLISLKGCPNTVIGHFDCCDNAKQFTKDELRSVCKVKGLIYVGGRN